MAMNLSTPNDRLETRLKSLEDRERDTSKELAGLISAQSSDRWWFKAVSGTAVGVVVILTAFVGIANFLTPGPRIGKLESKFDDHIGSVNERIAGLEKDSSSMKGTLNQVDKTLQLLLAKLAKDDYKPNVMIVLDPLQKEKKEGGEEWYVACHLMFTRLNASAMYCETYDTNALAEAAVGKLKDIAASLPGAKPITACESETGDKLPQFIRHDASFCYDNTPLGLTKRIADAMGEEPVYNERLIAPGSWQQLVQYANDVPDYFYACAYQKADEYSPPAQRRPDESGSNAADKHGPRPSVAIATGMTASQRTVEARTPKCCAAQ